LAHGCLHQQALFGGDTAEDEGLPLAELFWVEDIIDKM
jgi:hypothetical protein